MEFSVGLVSLAAMLVACGCGGPRATGSRGVALSSATSGLREASRSAPHAMPALEQGLQTGDYVVYRFSGSFRKASAAPLTLTERVLGREGRVLILEVVLDDGAKKQTIHLRKDSTPGAAREVFDVTSVEAGTERPATVEAYEAMMAKTVLAADQNEEQLGAEAASIVLGGKTLRCLKTSYRVRVGKHEATMSTVTSDTFPWGDVAGDIITLEGQVLYRVEVVDAGTRTRERDVGALRERAPGSSSSQTL
jgi:hypothetical protein